MVSAKAARLLYKFTLISVAERMLLKMDTSKLKDTMVIGSFIESFPPASVLLMKLPQLALCPVFDT